MYFILTLQVPLTLPSVISKTYSVFVKEGTHNAFPRACISQYNPMRVYWLVQALDQGSLDQVKVGPTPVLELHNLWRQIHMFLDILEFRIENTKNI